MIPRKIIYIFKCSRCKREKRESKYRNVAKTLVCRKCRYSKIDPNQVALFPINN